MTKVLREGRVETVKAESIVVGDIIQLAIGDIVPADLRLFEGMNVSTDEALLTGESLPVNKTPDITFSQRDISNGDRTNMAYAATTVTQGRAKGIVVSTAMRTEVGKIAALLRSPSALDSGDSSSTMITRTWGSFKCGAKSILGLVGTPLQVKLSKFALLLFALAILLAVIVFSVNRWDVHGEVLIYGICVAIAVIPESLIAVLTITMSLATKKMAKHNVIVRKLQALEALGGVTNICSDKTGTLTQGRMVARKAWVPEAGMLTVSETRNPVSPTSGVVQLNDLPVDANTVVKSACLEKFLQAIALCNLSSVYNQNDNGRVDNMSVTESSISTLEDSWTAVGEPTEIALQVLAMRFNLGRASLVEDGTRKLISEFPFDSSIKRMTVVYENPNSGITETFMKGATEAVLPTISISAEEKTRVITVAEQMAAEGLRVLCVAHKVISKDDGHISQRRLVESELSFVGLVGLHDPPRLETAGAVRKCQMAGITVHMLTGDHIKTATAIAYEVGIIGATVPTAQAGTAIMQAEDFDKLSDQQIDDIETLPLVLARCSPATKARMVDAMHRRNAFCVMTGDGVNDSPALKRADVGIAMGLNGSDVAKQAADMVLTNDDFASIVQAVQEGRRLFDNIQKVTIASSIRACQY
jgi:Na+-exporting ATPase